MATNTELKNQIDSQIKNKTAPASITKSNVADNIKQVIDYVDQEILTIPAGPTGPQGIQGNTGLTGPQGNPGPIGPAGLTWKGQWVSGTSYLKDDAVGHNGASWFCTTNTSGIIPPNSDIANWALLASQGAQGIQGPTGLTGPQGPSGAAGGGVLEYCAQIFQSGTDNPIPQFPKIDTISQGFNTDANYRAISFSRSGLGIYQLRVIYKTQYYVTLNKSAIMFGDSIARLTNVAVENFGPFFSNTYTFKTYTPEGVLSDGLLLGNNGTFINIKLYP